MKIKGFTLAEILIALGILGAIAAMTVPQFAANIHNQTNASRLSAIVSDYENIFGMMLLKEDKESLWETEFGQASNMAQMKTALEKYTKVVKTGRFSYPSCGGNNGGAVSSLIIPATYANDSPIVQSMQTFKTINGGTLNIMYVFAYSIPSGAIFFLSGNAGPTETMYIDVNGTDKPNTFGRDVFTFALGADGHLYPYGSSKAAELLGLSNPTTQTWNNTSASVPYRCTGTGYNGQGCTARLIENNYKMDY